MGLFSNLISSPKSLTLFILLLLFTSKTVQKDQGFISVKISKKGLDFAKDLIVQRALSSAIPLKLPQVEKDVSVPLIGKVKVALSNMTIDSVVLPNSVVETGENGVVLVCLNATARLSLDWSYFYSSWFVEVSDNGNASVEVLGLSFGVTIAMKDQEGRLNFSVTDTGCYVRTLIIKLNGGASWLYQRFVDVFQDVITARIEDAISSKIKEGIKKVDSLLQTLPMEIPIYEKAAMNVTFVSDPILTNSSIEFDINGLFVASENYHPEFYFYRKAPLDLGVASYSSVKMAEISLHEKVFNSVSSFFYNAGYLHWNVDKVQDQFLLNTSRWKYIIPKLYKKYPNEAMNLNISISSPPLVKILDNSDIDVTIYSDVLVNVFDSGEVVPVICISLEISASCSPKMVGNKLVGTLQLRDFEIFLKWTKVGNLHVHLLKSVITIALKRFVVPYANVYLWKGLPLPMLSGFTFLNSEIYCLDSKLVICSDVAFVEKVQSLQYV